MAFYSLKSIIPMFVPVATEGRVEYKQVDKLERVNLVGRNFLINGVNPAMALASFFSLPKEEPDVSFGVSTDSAFNCGVSLSVNITYLVVMQSNKKTSFYLYTPHLLREDEFKEVGFEVRHDESGYAIEDLFEVNELRTKFAVVREECFAEETPIDSLVKLRKANEVVKNQVNNYIASFDPSNMQSRFVAHTLKAIRNDWILKN